MDLPPSPGPDRIAASPAPISAPRSGSESARHSTGRGRGAPKAGAALGGVFAGGLGDYWYLPVYSVTMAVVTSAIAPR